MATAAPAKKAPAAKTPAKPAAKTPVAKAAAPAPAPAPEPEPVVEDGTVDVGSVVVFLGYAEGTPEAEQVLTAGEQYTIAAFTEAEGDDPGGNPILSAPNAAFNAKKKEHPETNPKFIEAEVLMDEIELAVEGDAETEGAEGEGEVEAVEDAKVVAETPAPAAKAAPAKAAKAAPAKAAPAKAAKAAPAKAAKPAKAPKEAAEPVDPDAVPDLTNEDPDVLALVDGAEDLIAAAQELEAQSATTEWQLGGLLYHIKKNKAHHSVTDSAGNAITEYQEPGGFDKFLKEFFNIEYRKAMFLIDIYVYFTQAGIADAAQRVAAIGWTKAKTIAKHLVSEGAKPEELLELAASNTVADLSEVIKDSIKVGGTPGTSVKRVTLKFRYLETEGAVVAKILETATATLGLKDQGEALSHIVTEWAAEKAGGTATKEAAPAQRAAAPAAKRAPVKAAAAK